jgi:hypothetical protein
MSLVSLPIAYSMVPLSGLIWPVGPFKGHTVLVYNQFEVSPVHNYLTYIKLYKHGAGI